MYDVGQGQGLDDASVNYNEIEPLPLSSNYDVKPLDDIDYVRLNLALIETYVI
jgi:hypothetical protein